MVFEPFEVVAPFLSLIIRVNPRYPWSPTALIRPTTNLNQMEAEEREEHADNSDDGFAHRPGFERLRHGQPEAVLHDPESGIVQMGQKEGAAAHRDNDQRHVRLCELGMESEHGY